MAINRSTIVHMAGAVVLADLAFLISFLKVYSKVLILLILVSLVALAVYHAFEGGSLITTTLIPILVAGGLMVGVAVNELGGCPPVPGCRLTPANMYLHWTFSAIVLGFGAYFVGGFARNRLPFRA